MAYLPDLDTTLGRFFDAWNAEDADARWSLVHAAVSEDAVVLDAAEPRPVVGRATLASALDAMRRRTGGITADGPARVVHNEVCLPVQLGGSPALFVGTVDGEGRLARVVLFAS